MNQSNLANEIAAHVIRDTKFLASIVGLIGTIIGAAIIILGNFLMHYVQNKKDGSDRHRSLTPLAEDAGLKGMEEALDSFSCNRCRSRHDTSFVDRTQCARL